MAPGAGTLAAEPRLGARRGEGSLDRRPQLLHDRLPLRDRSARRLLRDPTTCLDAPLGVRRQAAGLRPDRYRQGVRADDPSRERHGRDPDPVAGHGAPGPADAGRGDRTPPADQHAGQGRTRQGDRRLVPPALDDRNAFQELEATLNGEVNTLGYPKSALFAFCAALVSYDVLSTGQGGIAVGAWREEGGRGGLGL